MAVVEKGSACVGAAGNVGDVRWGIDDAAVVGVGKAAIPILVSPGCSMAVIEKSNTCIGAAGDVHDAR